MIISSLLFLPIPKSRRFERAKRLISLQFSPLENTIPVEASFIHYSKVGMRAIPVLEKYRYILYFNRYDIIISLNSAFHMLQLKNAPVGGSDSQIAAQPVNVTTVQRDGSNR